MGVQAVGCYANYLLTPEAHTILGFKVFNLDSSQRSIYAQATTAFYFSLVMGQIGAALAATTKSSSLINYKLPNMSLNVCIVLEILIAVLLMTVPTFQRWFQMATISLSNWVLPILLPFMAVVLLDEGRKYFFVRQT